MCKCWSRASSDLGSLGRDHCAYEQVARAVTPTGLGLDDSASRNLALVSCEGGEDFFLLASRHLDEVQRAPEFRSDLVEFLWRDTEVPMRLLETDSRFFRLGR